LAATADTLRSGEVDSITIAGNGEPTLSPHLDAIVDVVAEARDRDWPSARTVILTNGTASHRSSVRSALAKLDERVVKLDAGSNWVLEQMNRVAGRLSISELVHRIAMMPDVVIQSMFVHGPVDNTRPEHVEVWTECLKRIKPLGVQIYSLDRMPAMPWVRHVERPELESIARYVESMAGIPVHVY
jgi:wyosine [tRNA(Phe)-imidazoG37] synthetase (radical SAM superfamily)